MSLHDLGTEMSRLRESEADWRLRARLAEAALAEIVTTHECSGDVFDPLICRERYPNPQVAWARWCPWCVASDAKERIVKLLSETSR